MSDQQDKAEALDDAVIVPGDDRTDEQSAELPDLPPPLDVPVSSGCAGANPIGPGLASDVLGPGQREVCRYLLPLGWLRQPMRPIDEPDRHVYEDVVGFVS